jgi:hypothetical protein
MRKPETEPRPPAERQPVVTWFSCCGCGWQRACPTLELAQAAATVHRLAHQRASGPPVWS